MFLSLPVFSSPLFLCVFVRVLVILQHPHDLRESFLALCRPLPFPQVLVTLLNLHSHHRYLALVQPPRVFRRLYLEEIECLQCLLGRPARFQQVHRVTRILVTLNAEHSGVTVVVLYVAVSAALNEKIGDFAVLVANSHVQGCLPCAVLNVHPCTMVDEPSDEVEVTVLGGDVDGVVPVACVDAVGVGGGCHYLTYFVKRLKG